MKNSLAITAGLCALAGLLMATEEVISCCRFALRLCSELIMPSLFPFFVLTGLLGRLGLPALLGRWLGPLAERIFRCSGPGATAFFLGITGGYPMGAAFIADMERSGAVSPEEASRLLAFCNNSGPAFIVGAVGAGAFGSAEAGLFLYIIHILAAALTGFLLRPRQAPSAPPGPAALPRPMAVTAALAESVKQAVASVLAVCGFVVCFSVLVGLLDARGLFSLLSGRLSELLGLPLQFSRAMLTGLLELGSGVGAMRGLALRPVNLALAAGILGWGGLSVQFQTLALFPDSEIKTAPHAAGRLISGILGFLLAFFLGSLVF